MLPSNTNVPEVDNTPTWYSCQPVPGLYSTGLCIRSGHETRWYGPTGTSSLKELVYFSCVTPWTRNLVVVNTFSVDFMYKYKEMPGSLHTGVWEDFWRRKQLHFGEAEGNIHCDRGDLCCMYEYQLSV